MRRSVSAAAPGITSVLLALLITFLGAAPAHAHATLLATDPGSGAQLGIAPTEVRLTFSEPVRVVPGSTRLLRADGSGEDLPAHTVDRVVVVPLPELSGDARYSVTWRVVSADGHPISGLVSFSVGDVLTDSPAPRAPPAGDTTAGPALVITQGVATGVWYAGLLAVAGLLAFQVLCLRRVPGAEQPPGTDAAYSRLIGIGVIAGGLAAIALIPLQAVAAAGGPRAAPADWAALIGWQSPLVALLTCAGLGAALVLRRHGRDGAALACAALALASPSLTGHSAAVGPTWLMTAGDLVHLAAAAVWVGGVLGLVVYLRAHRSSGGKTPPAPARVAAEVVARFSGLATSAVFTAGLAGVVMALLVVPGRAALVGTDYGRLLLAKLALVVLAGAMGGWNRFRLMPALERPRAAVDPWRALTRILRVEATALAAVVLVTGFLVGQSPTGFGADHPSHAGHDHAPAATGPATIRGTSDHLVVMGTATPLEGGTTTRIEFSVTDPAGRPMQPIEPPTVTLTLPAQGLGPTPYESGASPAAPQGTYLVEVGTPVPGHWQIFVGVRLSTFTQETVRLDLEAG